MNLRYHLKKVMTIPENVAIMFKEEDVLHLRQFMHHPLFSQNHHHHSGMPYLAIIKLHKTLHAAWVKYCTIHLCTTWNPTRKIF